MLFPGKSCPHDRVSIVDRSPTIPTPVTNTTYAHSIKSIITSHFFFHLRQVYPEPRESESSFMKSTLRFATSMVGNIGAPVHNVLSGSFDFVDAEADDIKFSDDPLSTILMIGNPENYQDEAGCSYLELTPTQYDRYAVDDSNGLVSP